MTETKKRARVLVVDSDVANALLVEAALSSQGYEIARAYDGQQALYQVQRIWPDVIIMDRQAPKLDSLAVAKKLKSDPATALIPVLLVSATSRAAERLAVYQAGADDFLAKPYQNIELIAKVKSLVKVSLFNHSANFDKQLDEEVTRRTAELQWLLSKLKSASLDLVFYLCQAAESRDEDSGHIKRLAYYARCIGEEMGLPEAELDSLLYSVPMHDIGKIRIPDRILLKPEKLTPEEWDVTRRHTQDIRFLENDEADYIKSGEVIATTHHERWDGSGYPDGLRGEAIPLSGRIAAVADNFDSMTTPRPYRRQALSADEAAQTLEAGSGTQFDPAVVKAFKESWTKILAIREKYRAEQQP